MIQAGKLNRRITISAPSTVGDAFGQTNTVYTPVYSCWASISETKEGDRASLSGSGSGFVSEVSHKVVIRFTTSFVPVPGMRVTYESRNFRLQAASDSMEGREFYVLQCMELH